MANYGGDSPNNTAYLKKFVYGPSSDLWRSITYRTQQNDVINVLTPTTIRNENVYIPGNLYVDGDIVSPSDLSLKTNVESIPSEVSRRLMELKPSQYSLKSDPTHQLHYGFIAQEVEPIYPELVHMKPHRDKQQGLLTNRKAIHYMELIPLLVQQMQHMQHQIDDLTCQLQQTTTTPKQTTTEEQTTTTKKETTDKA